MTTLSSGNPIVDAVSKINFTGDITPRIWRKTITKENGKPYALARDLLSDFVYFYRAKETIDPQTGVVTLEKKFKYDMLYRSYAQLTEEYGESQQTIRRALNRLEQIGVIKKHLRTVEENGFKYNNVLFIEIIPDVLLRLTYPSKENVTNCSENVNREMNENDTKEVKTDESTAEDTEITEEIQDFNLFTKGMKEEIEKFINADENGAKMAQNGDLIPPPTKNGRRVLSNLEGHTENTTKSDNNIYNITQSIKSKTDNIKQSSKEMDGEDNQEQLRCYIAQNIKLDCLIIQANHDATEKAMVMEIYDIICDMVIVPRDNVVIKGIKYPWETVKSQFMKLSNVHIANILNRILKQQEPIKHMHPYLVSALYTESLSGTVQAQSELYDDYLNYYRGNPYSGYN